MVLENTKKEKIIITKNLKTNKIMIKDFIRFVILHRWNKIDESYVRFAELSEFNPKRLHLRLYNYIKKINNI
jgi:hypothetical protein